MYHSLRVPNSMSSQQAPANQSLGESHESVMQFGSAFIAAAQATKLMQPSQGSLDHPTIDTEPTARRRVAPGQERLDAHGPPPRAMRLRVIRAVTLHALGALTSSSAFALRRTPKVTTDACSPAGCGGGLPLSVGCGPVWRALLRHARSNYRRPHATNRAAQPLGA